MAAKYVPDEVKAQVNEIVARFRGSYLDRSDVG
jgi:hypothetical protein